MGESVMPIEERVEIKNNNSENDLDIDKTESVNGQKDSYANIVRGKK